MFFSAYYFFRFYEMMNTQHLQLIVLLSHELQEEKSFNLGNSLQTLMFLSEECQSGKILFDKFL